MAKITPVTVVVKVELDRDSVKKLLADLDQMLAEASVGEVTLRVAPAEVDAQAIRKAMLDLAGAQKKIGLR